MPHQPHVPSPARSPKTVLTLSLFAAVALAACQTPGNTPEETPAAGSMSPASISSQALAAAQAVTADDLRAVVAELASDAYEGRGPATAGDQKTQTFIADQLSKLGLAPGGPDGSWFQPFDVVSVTADSPATWAFHAGDRSLELAYWDQFVAASAVQTETAEVEDAEVVFVGYGIQAPEYDWDDYKGLDVSGKLLLMLNNDPDWQPELFAGNRRLYYGRWTYKYEIAAELGAVGTIIIHTTPSAGYPFNVVQTGWTGPQFELPATSDDAAQIEGWLSEDAAAQLAALGGQDLEALVAAARSRDFQPVPLGVTTSLRLTNEVSRVETGNVAGLLEGSDPQLAQEVVVLTAHHDHLGISEADDSGDTTYNGALDNAAGVAQLLAIGKALRALPERPRRSVLLLLVAAEEQGLLGSEYYASHPTFAAGRIAANVNLDGGNIWGRTRDLTYIGYGKSSLDTVVDAAAASQQRTVRGDQFPDRGFFYRSDQFNFAKIGVPAIYIDSGTDFIDRPAGWGQEQMEAWEEEKYHQPGDELEESWNFDGMVEDARLAFLATIAIANADAMPSWNSGDEFEAARLAALAAVE